MLIKLSDDRDQCPLPDGRLLIVLRDNIASDERWVATVGSTTLASGPSHHEAFERAMRHVSTAKGTAPWREIPRADHECRASKAPVPIGNAFRQ